jgi:hypothetical protein
MTKSKSWNINSLNSNQVFSDAKRMMQAGEDYQLVLKKGKKRSLPAN